MLHPQLIVHIGVGLLPHRVPLEHHPTGKLYLLTDAPLRRLLLRLLSLLLIPLVSLSLALLLIFLVGIPLKILETFASHMLVEVAISVIEGLFGSGGLGLWGSIEYIIGVIVFPELPVTQNVVGLLDLRELQMSFGVDVGV